MTRQFAGAVEIKRVGDYAEKLKILNYQNKKDDWKSGAITQ